MGCAGAPLGWPVLCSWLPFVGEAGAEWTDGAGVVWWELAVGLTGAECEESCREEEELV